MATTMTAIEYAKLSGFNEEDAAAILATAFDSDERQHALIVAISHTNTFAAKVANTVLSTGRISAKQADILSDAAGEEIYISDDVMYQISSKIADKNEAFKRTALS